MVGVDHVCIGGDYFNFPYYSEKYGCSLAPVPGLDSKEGFVLLRKNLLDSGFSDNEIESVFSRNVDRFNAEIEVFHFSYNLTPHFPADGIDFGFTRKRKSF